MINKLRILGEYVYKNEGDINPLNLNLAMKSANVIILDFTMDGHSCIYRGTDIIEFDPSKRKSILYKNAPAQVKSPFPTYNVFYIKDPDKRRKNVEKSIKKFTQTLKHNSTINLDLEPLYSFICDNKESLLEGILEHLSSDSSNLLSIRINNELVGDSRFYQPVIENYLSSVDEEYYSKYNTISRGENIQCFLCRKTAPKLYGFCDTFKFYSANELAYIAGGFQKKITWKNYPVCPECAKFLRMGKEKINSHFDRYFYGNKYFLIPSPTIDKGNFYSLFQDIEEELSDLSLNKEQENNQQIRREMEDYVFDTLARQKDQLTFTFFFYSASNSEFKILQEAEDILPSRFQRIIDAKKKVEANEEFRNLKGLYKKGEVHNLSFNFGIVRTFFPSNFNNDFLDITTKILKGQPISRQFIIHQISEHLARGFRQEKLYHDIEKAMIFLKFLYELNLIEQTKGILEVEMDNKYEDYFNRHPEFYDADWKKAVFLTGVLAQHVMDIQYRERNATPFRSRLNGLKLDHRAIKRLLPESIEKLEQYKSNYYRDLEEVISKFMESGEPELKQESVDEISFYFAMGLNLNKQFKSKHETEGEDNE